MAAAAVRLAGFDELPGAGTRYNVEPHEAVARWKASKDQGMDLATLITEELGVGVCPDGLGRVEVTGVCGDSRAAQPGHVFVALSGSKADGAAFAADAVKRGAVAVVADRDADVGPLTAPVIRVPDARAAVARLARGFYGLGRIQADGRFPVVGVTGTNGKSTFAYMVRALLQRAGLRPAMLGTIEYDLVGRKVDAALTTPDAVTLTQHLVEAAGHGADSAVMEVSSHALDQRRTDGIRFATGVFTNLTQDHLDYHGTLENYRDAKRRLFEQLDRSATAVLNAHDPNCDHMAAACRGRVQRFGLDSRADVRGGILQADIGGGTFVLDVEGRQVSVRTPMVGRHNILNALAAAAAGLSLGLDLEIIADGIARLDNVPGRLERVDTGDLGFDIFVDYAHTDDALRNVLSAVRPLTRERLWCVFGCGGDRDPYKRPLMARAVTQGADRFVITSDNPRTEDPQKILQDIERGVSNSDRERGTTIADRREAIQHAIERLEPGDALIIAGKGHENYQILGTQKIHFDDVEVAREAVARRQSAACAR